MTKRVVSRIYAFLFFGLLFSRIPNSLTTARGQKMKIKYCNSWLGLTTVSPPGVADRTIYITRRGLAKPVTIPIKLNS